MRSTLTALVALLVLSVSAAAWADGKIDVQGSTTVLPIMQKEVEAFMAANKGVEISVSGGGSGNGIKAIIDKTTDLAMASRAMKDKELATAKEKGGNPVQHVIAVDAILPIVNPANPVTGLTSDQLKAIYAGEVKNWKDVGGLDKPIVVISRDTSSGTYETWEEKILKGAKVAPSALLQASSGAVIQTVSKNPNAIGYDGIGYVDKSVKALKVDGIEGTEDTAKSGKYPVARELYVYTNGEPKGDVKKLIEFILSDKGQALVKEAGFVRLK
jgi:phosphate transport system substrate-binding protein